MTWLGSLDYSLNALCLAFIYGGLLIASGASAWKFLKNRSAT